VATTQTSPGQGRCLMTPEERTAILHAFRRLTALGLSAQEVAQQIHTLTQRLQAAGASAEALARQLTALQGDGGEIPDTPMEEWLRGVDQLLADLEREGTT